MFGIPEMKVEVFENLYLEDYNKICREAEEIKREAEFEKAAGNTKAYLTLLSRHQIYTNTAETMLDVVIKHPVDKV